MGGDQGRCTPGCEQGRGCCSGDLWVGGWNVKVEECWCALAVCRWRAWVMLHARMRGVKPRENTTHENAWQHSLMLTSGLLKHRLYAHHQLLRSHRTCPTLGIFWLCSVEVCWAFAWCRSAVWMSGQRLWMLTRQATQCIARAPIQVTVYQLRMGPDQAISTGYLFRCHLDGGS